MSLAIGAKVPGQGTATGPGKWTSSTAECSAKALPDAYELLSLDAMLGDATLFTRVYEIEEQWALRPGVRRCRRATASFPELRGGDAGAVRLGRAVASRRMVVAPPLEPALIEDGGRRRTSTVASIERELARLRTRRRRRRTVVSRISARR